MRARDNAIRNGKPDAYKPLPFPKALKLIQGTARALAKEGLQLEHVKSPVDNKVSGVFIHVTDLRRAAEWYSAVMGLPLLENRLNGEPIYCFDLDGGANIVLDNHYNEPDEPHALFNYLTADIQAAYRYAESKGINMLTGIKRPHEGLAYFSIADPDGNAVMITQSDYAAPPMVKTEDSCPIRARIGSIFINVTDMGRAIRFHSELLSLPYDAEDGGEDSIYGLQMKAGSGILLDNNRFKQGDDYHTLFMLLTGDIYASKQYLASMGVETFTDIEEYGELAFFTVKDPDGNVIMICKE